MTVAYSLIRFSTPQQADGDSIRRQNAPTMAFCNTHGLELDTSLHESDVRRLGVSAFKGEHIRNGALGKFIRLVDAGKVTAGSWLIVEEIDRLTRQVHDKAYDLCLHLMRAGITIATMMDGEVYDLDGINRSLEKRLKLMLRLDAAHDYSAKLSSRITSVWEGRREDMRAGKGKPTNACPRWLQAIDGEFVEFPERVAIIKRIIAERHRRIGRHEIATRLNREGIPTFHGGDGWHGSTIAMLVKNKALIGIYQPRKADGSPDGADIMGFYPRVISDDDFWRAQWGPDNKLSPGRKTEGFANLLSGICRCARCAKEGKPGAGLIYLNTGKNQFLVCNKARRGLCDNRYHRMYPKLERELLSLLGLLDFTRILDRGNPHAERVGAIEAEAADANATIERLVNDFRKDTPKAVSERIGALSRKLDMLTDELEEAKRVAHIAEASESRDAYEDFRALVDALPTMPDDEGRKELRRKIANELRRLIESATADGTELTIRLRGSQFYRIELLVHRSTVESLCLTAIDTGNSYRFPRNVLFGDADLAGLFAAYVGSGSDTATA